MRSRRRVDYGMHDTSCSLNPVMITNLDKFEPLQARSHRDNTTLNVSHLHTMESRIKGTSSTTNTASTATTLTMASKTSTFLTMTYAEEEKEIVKEEKCYLDMCWEPIFVFAFKRRRRRHDFLTKGDNTHVLSRRPDGFLALVVDDDVDEDDDRAVSIGSSDEGEDSRPLSLVTYDTPRTPRNGDPTTEEDTPQHVFAAPTAITGDSTGNVWELKQHCSKKLSYDESCFHNEEVLSPLSSSGCSQTFCNIPLSSSSAFINANATMSIDHREKTCTASRSFSESLQLEPSLTNGKDVDCEQGVAVSNNDASSFVPPSQRILEEASLLYQSALDCEQCNNYNKSDEAACLLLETLTLLQSETSLENSEEQTQIRFLRIKTLHRLGVFYWKTGYYTDSLKFLTNCLMSQEALSPSYTDNDHHLKFLKADTHRAIGSAHLSLGHYNEAQKWLRSSIRHLKEIRVERCYLLHCQQCCHSGCTVTDSVAAETIALILSLSALGSVYQEQGLYGRAFKLFRRSLHYYQLHCDVWGTSGAADYSFLVANTWNMIGSVYEASGQHREAMASFSEALWLYRLSFGYDHVDIAVTYVNIGRLHLIAWNEPQQALEAFHEALRVFKMFLGDSHRNTAAVYYNLAMTHVFLQEFGRAIEYFDLCLHIQRGMLGNFHLDVASTLYSMAQMYEKLQNFDEALHLYKAALQIQTTSLGKMHLFVAITLHQIVAIKFNGSTSLSLSLRKYCTQILQVYQQSGVPAVHRRFQHILSLIKERR